MDDSTTATVQPKNHTLGVISLISGILGVLLVFCCPYVPIVLGLVALVCGILARQQQQNYALAGIILGAIVIVFGIIFAIVGHLFFREIMHIIEQELRMELSMAKL